jgi:hypothetical protein
VKDMNTTKDLKKLAQKQICGTSRRYKMLMSAIISLSAATVLTISVSAADGVWGTVIGYITTWIPRLGGAVAFVGLIMFGLGWQQEDASGKSRGIQTIVAGAIVAAAGLGADAFLNASG